MRLLLLLAAASLVMAACGSAASPAPSAASDGVPLPTLPGSSAGPAGSAQASDAPVPTEGESHVAPELEALLPATFESVALARQSTTGDQALSDDPSSDSIRAFLASVGKAPRDLRFAQAYDDTGQLDLAVFAFSVPGVGADALSQALAKSALANNPKLVTATATVGGRTVHTASDPDLGTGSYMYVHDDVVFDVETQDKTIAAEVLAGLP